jgi:hypothetical protein
MRCLVILAAAAATFVSADAFAAECTCRAQGRDHTVGTTICLSTGNGSRLATCGMMLNNTTWEMSQTPCGVTSERAPAPTEPVENRSTVAAIRR